ncbi:hypothetical protein GCM10025870_27120 [Agromyces marinus]|uniref:Uncharacterized protein n=1 Tax=Agromyces marinus TaxID=1389020 RepID=A0ABN6YE08_9MICO|nr:hypothetical protein GCM10025870_27120 [Agromyces marinus]
MIDADHVLLDDRPLVEVARDEVRRGADELDPAPVRLPVGVRPLEPREERVVDVDAAARERIAQLGERICMYLARTTSSMSCASTASSTRRSNSAFVSGEVTGADSNGTP